MASTINVLEVGREKVRDGEGGEVGHDEFIEQNTLLRDGEPERKRPRLAKSDSSCANDALVILVGDKVKLAGNVVQTRKVNRKRQPNINCRVEAYGCVCKHFDELRRRWVCEMGFGGLLYMIDMTLPRTLCYWLMTRVNPIKETLTLNDGYEYSLTSNQVRWVLGIPYGGKVIPRVVVDEEMRVKVEDIKRKYGLERNGVIKSSGKKIRSKGVSLNDEILQRLKGVWVEDDEMEFKQLFMLMSLQMVLCPTQGPCLEPDLIPALTVASEAIKYDWCSLVFEKLMCNVKRFSQRFDKDGYAGGCGGCAIFVAIYYLDRLDRKPNNWGVFPRIKVWNAVELRKASRDDRMEGGGDYGKLPCFQVGYGHKHPLDSGDKPAPLE